MIRQFLEIGQIVGTHGVQGEIRFTPWCDSPEFLKNFKILYFKDGGPLKVLSSRVHKNIVLLKVEGVDTVEQAAALRNRTLFMNRDDAPLEEGDYFIQDLMGCAVVDADTGERYGELSDVSMTGANDVWHVMGGSGKEYLIPAIAEVIVDTDVKNGIIKIRPLEGIFDDGD